MAQMGKQKLLRRISRQMIEDSGKAPDKIV